jgi:NAD(P)H dehydrogenase (quinone)
MKHLIICGHPNPASLNNHLKDLLAEILTTNGHEVVIRDLDQLYFNPVLSLADFQGQFMGTVTDDVKQEQEYVSWADHITFVYPIWWMGMPAVIKGYIDRVFSYGFAYSYDEGVQKGLLKGKQVSIINTHGRSQAEYEAIGMYNAFSLIVDKGTFNYCGLEVKHHLYFDNAAFNVNAETVEKWDKQIKSTYES